jgi:hypothetical protein
VKITWIGSVVDVDPDISITASVSQYTVSGPPVTLHVSAGTDYRGPVTLHASAEVEEESPIGEVILNEDSETFEVPVEVWQRFAGGPISFVATSEASEMYGASRSETVTIRYLRTSSVTLSQFDHSTLRAGSEITLLATVTPTEARGSVKFVAAAPNSMEISLGVAVVDEDGSAALRQLPIALPAGPYRVVATYSGDDAHTPSTSAGHALNIVVSDASGPQPGQASPAPRAALAKTGSLDIALLGVIALTSICIGVALIGRATLSGRSQQSAPAGHR